MLQRMQERAGSLGAAVYAAVLALVVLAAAGAVGLMLHQPWLFPSLGPTVMLFFESPQQKASRPLNALIGHAMALLAGIAAVLGLGLVGAPSAAEGGLTPAYLVAGAGSLAVTTFVLTALRTPHPPAGATTLIVSLGVLSGAAAWASMAGAVVLVTALGWGLNLLLGTRPAGAPAAGGGTSREADASHGDSTG
ncbi:HPP family protein [Brachybacterium sp. GCM10030252]|uniref:HPP family protein n=1 Tax=Brachybacterium sp. GCM10030252 TaxID=3273380 RepID=UPI0036191668